MSDGLRFPTDLDAWRRWADGRQGILGTAKALKARLRSGDRGTTTAATLHVPTGEPRVLVVMDNLSPSCRLVIHEPLAFMDLDHVAVLAHGDPELPGGHDWEAVPFDGMALLPNTIHDVLSLGAFNALSEPISEWAGARDVRFNVVQHGLMTPWAPPLNDGAHLLAWSEADAHFWSADRPSITWETVGSQMLWNAGQSPTVKVSDERPVMLGQLHGIELGRVDKLRTYADFCSRTTAEYRPHPNEHDALSRVGHAWMKRRGVEFETSGLGLTDLARPVVSIFSTGTLEAAQRGLPAWVHHPNPPEWVRSFWGRYGLARYGHAPTAPWQLGQTSPAELIAGAVEGR